MKNEEESMKLVKEEGFRSLFNLKIPCGLPQGYSSSVCYMAIDTLRLAAGFFIQTFSKFDAKKEVYTAKGKAKYGIAHKAR